jgi:D-hexose-6-phosphate mutarotase
MKQAQKTSTNIVVESLAGVHLNVLFTKWVRKDSNLNFGDRKDKQRVHRAYNFMSEQLTIEQNTFIQTETEPHLNTSTWGPWNAKLVKLSLDLQTKCMNALLISENRDPTKKRTRLEPTVGAVVSCLEKIKYFHK